MSATGEKKKGTNEGKGTRTGIDQGKGETGKETGSATGIADIALIANPVRTTNNITKL